MLCIRYFEDSRLCVKPYRVPLIHIVSVNIFHSNHFSLFNLKVPHNNSWLLSFFVFNVTSVHQIILVLCTAFHLEFSFVFLNGQICFLLHLLFCIIFYQIVVFTFIVIISSMFFFSLSLECAKTSIWNGYSKKETI